MKNGNELDFIDFEEEKAKLWMLAYSEIKRILLLKGLVNQRVELPSNGLIVYVKLELPDVLLLEDAYGKKDFAEYYSEITKIAEEYNIDLTEFEILTAIMFKYFAAFAVLFLLNGGVEPCLLFCSACF